MHPILFQIGKLSIHSYGFMLAIGFTLSLVLFLRRGKQEGFQEDNLLDLDIVAIISGLLGARLFYVFFYDCSYFSQHLLEIFDPRSQGLVFYGSLLLGIPVTIAYVKYKKLSFWKVTDLFAPFVALGYAFTRIGCFLNGCCYGKPTDLPWAVVFPNLDPLPRHPTQIYSSVISFGLFFLLYWLYKRRRFDGQIFAVYLVLYSAIRFMIESLRENLVVWQGLTISQVIAAGGIVIGGIMYLWLAKKPPHEAVLKGEE
ncbi:MAG: prolipoprotein diacylglyceryl transferase [Candidatus Saccharibacteria bacterium]